MRDARDGGERRARVARSRSNDSRRRRASGRVGNLNRSLTRNLRADERDDGTGRRAKRGAAATDVPADADSDGSDGARGVRVARRRRGGDDDGDDDGAAGADDDDARGRRRGGDGSDAARGAGTGVASAQADAGRGERDGGDVEDRSVADSATAVRESRGKGDV